MDLTSKKVAVTGATGFLGGYLVRSLIERGATPVAVVRNPERARSLAAMGVEIREADLGDVEALSRAFQGMDAVIANAGLVSIKPLAWQQYLETNVKGVIHTFEATRAAGVGRVIQISTVGIYRDFSSPISEDNTKYDESQKGHRFNGYKLSKALAEAAAWRHADKYDIALTTLRPTVVYGAFDPTFSHWHKFLLRMRPLAPYPWWTRLALVYAGDIAEAAMLSLENPIANGKAYNVAGEDRDIWEFGAAWLQQDETSNRWRIPLPSGICRYYSTEAIRNDLGWTPRSYEAGIAETLALEADSGCA
jgi:nucleoside-diphosphate-sugar epimerase